MLRMEELREDTRAAKRARHKAMIDVQKRVQDDRMKTQATRAEVLEQKQKVAAEVHKLA